MNALKVFIHSYHALRIMLLESDARIVSIHESNNA